MALRLCSAELTQIALHWKYVACTPFPFQLGDRPRRIPFEMHSNFIRCRLQTDPGTRPQSLSSSSKVCLLPENLAGWRSRRSGVRCIWKFACIAWIVSNFCGFVHAAFMRCRDENYSVNKIVVRNWSYTSFDSIHSCVSFRAIGNTKTWPNFGEYITK